MDKSYVSMEGKMCVCCGKPFDSGAILLDKRLKASMERQTVTGLGLCKECQLDGFVTLIVIDETNNKINPTQAWKTGEVVKMKHEAFKGIFKCELPSNGFIYIDRETAQVLERLKEEADGEDNRNNNKE